MTSPSPTPSHFHSHSHSHSLLSVLNEISPSLSPSPLSLSLPAEFLNILYFQKIFDSIGMGIFTPKGNGNGEMKSNGIPMPSTETISLMEYSIRSVSSHVISHGKYSQFFHLWSFLLTLCSTSPCPFDVSLPFLLLEEAMETLEMIIWSDNLQDFPSESFWSISEFLLKYFLQSEKEKEKEKERDTNTHSHSPSLFSPKSKLILLRTLNSVLKRISKVSHPSFCGQIQRFLSFILPLDDRSSVNINGKYNSESAAKGNENHNSNDTDEITNTMYYHIWGIQKHFYDTKVFTFANGNSQSTATNHNNNPIQTIPTIQQINNSASSSADLPSFLLSLEIILKHFESNSLNERDALAANSNFYYEIFDPKNDYQTGFPKYLPSKKLLNLQLIDSNFRRHFLIQCVIHMGNTVENIQGASMQNVNNIQNNISKNPFPLDKNKIPSQSSTPSSSSFPSPSSPIGWNSLVDTFRSLYSRVIRQLRLTPPNALKFSEDIHQLLWRENHFIQWKLSKAPKIAKEKISMEKSITNHSENKKHRGNSMGNERNPKRRRVHLDINSAFGYTLSSMKSSPRVPFGHLSLSLLFNCAQNEESAKDFGRKFSSQTADSVMENITETIQERESDVSDDDSLSLFTSDPKVQFRLFRSLRTENFSVFCEEKGNIRNVIKNIKNKIKNQKEMENKIENPMEMEGDGQGFHGTETQNILLSEETIPFPSPSDEIIGSENQNLNEIENAMEAETVDGPNENPHMDLDLDSDLMGSEMGMEMSPNPMEIPFGKPMDGGEGEQREQQAEEQNEEM